MGIVLDKKILSKACTKTSILTAQSVINQLEYELNNSKTPGVGLAANQIGVCAQVCIIRAQSALDLVNPIIEQKYELMEFHNEGCLSFPDQWIKTKRYNEILVRDDLHPAGIICTGFEAVIVQHEVAHLFGETMYDYAIEIPGVNQPCWCNSGKKYKKCHMGKVIKQGFSR